MDLSALGVTTTHPPETEGRLWGGNSDSTNLANPDLVHHAATNGGGFSDNSSEPTRPSAHTTGMDRGGSRTAAFDYSVSRLAALRYFNGLRGIPTEDVRYQYDYLADNTQRAYQQSWNKWVCWCQRHEQDPLCRSVGLLCSFLIATYEEGNVSASSLANLRAAIGQTWGEFVVAVDGLPTTIDISTNLQVSRVIKSCKMIAFERTPEALTKVRAVFDVTVTDWFVSGWGCIEELSLQQLTHHLAYLLI